MHVAIRRTGRLEKSPLPPHLYFNAFYLQYLTTFEIVLWNTFN